MWRLLLLFLGLTLALPATLRAEGEGAEPEDAAQVREVMLTHSPQLESVVGRRMLRHLLACALADDLVATAVVAGETFRFPGIYGLAPGWLDGAANVSEQRWVSACIMAQVSYYGAGVALSLRAPGLALESFEPSEKELESYTVHEGGYFGNLFAAAPAAFACQGAWAGPEGRHGGSPRRVCAEPAEDPELAGQGLSRCGFRLVGACDRRADFEVAGQRYSEVIHVFLKPAE